MAQINTDTIMAWICIATVAAPVMLFLLALALQDARTR